MTMRAGTRLGPYEIVSPLGAGGMGEVYRARDTRLDRSVAVKILPSDFAHDAQLRLRFEREAKTISKLTHPNICMLHDIGNESGVDYLVMELLDGETLADRLTKGPLPIEQVLRYGEQIAGALDNAHRAGVVHRDLKPGNVMLTKNGAKLLDFGLAKGAAAVVPARQQTGLSVLHTEQKPLTEEGMILGTFQYMAPEQIEGVEADHRTDIFGLGAVLYEMATGRRAFDGKTRTSVIAAIIDRQPTPISQVQPLTPAGFEHVVSKCLEKDPEARWQSARDVADELRWIGSAPPAQTLTARRTWPLAWLAAAVLLIAGAAGAFLYLRRDVEPARVIRTDITTPRGVRLLTLGERGGGALSPDGTRIAFVGVDATAVPLLYVRRLSEADAKPLPGTAGAALPFWSFDSRSVAFFADGKLKRIDIDGARATVVAENVDGRGGSWASNGTIVFAPSSSSGLTSVPAAGGDPVVVTRLTGDQNSHRFPSFLPDGKHFVYCATGNKDRGVYIGSLDGRTNRRLVDSFVAAVVAEPSHLLFVRGDVVMAQQLDLQALTLTGTPVEIASGLDGAGGFGSSGLTVSSTGALAYPTGVSGFVTLTVRDRTGKVLKSFGGDRVMTEPAFAPDDKRVALAINRPAGAADIWQIELERGRTIRLTFDRTGAPSSPVWTPDGQRVVYATERDGKPSIDWRALNGSEGERLAALPNPSYPESFSADGTLLTFSCPGPTNSFDVWTMSVPGGRTQPLINSASNETKSRVSPDGQFIAYTSDESGRPEVFIQTFPPSGAKWQVSTSGGDQAFWRKDGKELFFLQADGKLMAATIDLTSAAGLQDPVALFQTQLTPVSITGNRNQYLARGNGQEFVLLEPVSDPLSRIALVLNWRSLLPR